MTLPNTKLRAEHWKSPHFIFCILKAQDGNPELLHLLRRERIEPGVRLQIVEGESGVPPGEVKEELNLEHGTDLVNVQNRNDIWKKANSESINLFIMIDPLINDHAVEDSW